jgi:hypothetical protein
VPIIPKKLLVITDVANDAPKKLPIQINVVVFVMICLSKFSVGSSSMAAW